MRTLAVLLLASTLTIAADDKPRGPALTVAGDDGNVALELTALTVRATVRGHLARTELELTWRNSLDRETGGEFTFPLPADAEVSDVGLWFGEHLRHGVAVERVLARKAYEETIHRGVDPALVEWRSGREFSYEVYPIPAKGEKKVFLAYDQELTASDYELDLRWAPKNTQLHVDGQGRETHLNGIVRVPREVSETAFLARGDDGAWYASAAVDLARRNDGAVPAQHVLILVDASASSVRQNAAKLRAFLTKFLERQNAWATADVVPFHIALDTPRRIAKAGTAAGAIELERALRELQPVGAANLLEVMTRLPELIESLPPATRIVLVTDGLTPLGDARDVAAAVRKLANLRRPILVVNAANSADDLLLANAAQVTGGWHVDLTRTEIDSAVDASMQMPARVSFDGIVPQHILVASAGRFAIAQRSTQPIQSFAAKLPLRELHGATERAMVRRAYARIQLRELLARGASDEEVIAHGRAFTQVTPRTSLLVLDTWQDYERYGIELPPDLVEAKQRDFEKAQRQREEAAKLDALLRLVPPPVTTQNAWSMHGTVMIEDGTPLPGVSVRLMDGNELVSAAVTDENGRYVLFASQPPKAPRVLAHLAGFGTVSRAYEQIPAGSSVPLVISSAVSETITVTAEAPLLYVARSASAATTSDLLHAMATERVIDSDDPEVRAVVTKERRALTKGVLEKMREMRTTSERLRYYLSSRALLGGDKSFHVFSAEIFRQRSPEIAARVLLDLAESQPDNAPMLRLLARVLEGWGERALARLLLLRAIEIAPEEPQSFRELMLLDAREGRVAAVASHAKRFQNADRGDRDVREIYEQIDEALQQWERAGAHQQQRGIDLRAREEDDITIDLMYDTGWLWMDLHVTEPSGERVAWDDRTSDAGGRVIGGYIFGYGPQIYTIAKAPRGTYRVDVDYYNTDDTNVSQETLAHVIIIHKGERREMFLVLSEEKERRTLTTVEVE